ncbi:SusD/RagB family nutrient-binding outer membrane lipoprotein [Chryseobacterium foetidum]|uniref:SusD/RagB family nutrient-binding outer membrane lipoprotein n=1 Tax=Chryseobacterium foetidum TaxID=2951057 RepID=UPI0021C91779|nr:SusD/RagB family nutrient-binding outer membrane lipoprotein [Chryseobacterium foetidum]
MKKIFLYSSLALVAFVSSCREIDDNISPNNVDPSEISPRQTLTAAQNLVMTAQAGTMNSLSNVWTNTWAGNYYYFGNPLTREYSLDISNTFGTGIWSSSYNAANNLQGIIDKGSALPLHSAIARILKAYQLQYVVDFYGDAPYSEAFKGQNNLTPRYDDDVTIYRALVEEINKAILDIDNTVVNGNTVVTPQEDVIFGGNMANWKKFAKNVKLKLLLRQSKVTTPSVRSYVDAQLQTLATSSTADFYVGDVVINPGYSNKNSATPNPLFSNYGAVNFQGSSLNTNGWRLYKASQYYANSVNGTLYGSTTGDYRGSQIFRRATTSTSAAPQPPSSVVGIRQGGVKPAGSTEWQYSYIGWKFIGSTFDETAPTQIPPQVNPDISNQAIYAMVFQGDTSAGSYIAEVGGAMDGYLALASENQLLLAEAATLYPGIFTFSAQGAYNTAVQNSFAFYKLLPARATNYLNALNNTSVGWNGASNKILAIQYQRFVSLANLRQVETYINFLKTGYPAIPNADNAIFPNKPYRLIYPVSEYTGNSSNVPNVSQAQVFVKNQFTPFWNQN